MLGKLIRIDITNKIGSPYPGGGVYELNQGDPVGKYRTSSPISGVLVMGIDNPVSHFDGRIIASVRFLDNGEVKLIASPKSRRYIDCEIRKAAAFLLQDRPYILDCLYERSCGAVIYRSINGATRFLLIKNRRSSNWGFPKGHMEAGETPEMTAKREVLEETGIHLCLIPDFVSKSEYTIQGKIEKSVLVFVGCTDDTQTKIQREELEDYIWLPYDEAISCLKFENDKNILREAKDFLFNHKLINGV